MFESGSKGKAAKKAYEIAYALFRISAKISESSVKEKLESKAIDLLVLVNAEEYGSAIKVIAAIDSLVKFATDLNIINISNGDIFIREIAVLNEAIVVCLDKSDDIDVSKFFGKPANVIQDQISNPAVPAAYHAPVPPVSMGNVSEYGNPASNVIKSGNRQIAILDKIRQSGNCKLREIQEVLPNCSERTIRYDLEELIERNLVERMGSGGPAISYKIRQTV